MTVSEDEARRVAEGARQREWRGPSFARELFLGRFRPDLIHPRPEPDPVAARHGQTYLDRLRAFCERAIDGARIDREGRVPDEVVAGLRAIGAFGMKIAPEYGGIGLNHLYYNRALALVGSASPAVGAMLSAHQSIGVPEPLKLFGTEEQKRAFLPRCARGEISAFLLTEPDVGSDPARLAATAERDGDSYVLDGVKLWTTNGVVADLLVVMAKVPDAGITAFVVEADSPGITVEHRNEFMGLRGLENGVTRLYRVRVPAVNRIGDEGEGLRIALTTLTTGRLAMPATCAAAGKWCLRVGREWSQARIQWGKPIARHEAIGSRLAFIAATTFAMEAVLDLVSELADEGGRDIRIEAAIAKLYGSEMAWRMADDLVQIRGGRGFETADSLVARGERGVPAEQLLRDLRIYRIFEGSSEIMRLLIAREAVDTHLRIAGGLIEPDSSLTEKRRALTSAGRFYARWLPSLTVGRGQLPLSYGDFHVSRHPNLAAHLRYVERAARRLARETFFAMSRWRGRLETKQRLLARIVDIGSELFVMSAACVHAERLRDQDDHGRQAYRLADVFCRQARQRVEALFAELLHNTDVADQTLVRELLEGDYRWLEEGILDPTAEGPWIAQTTSGPATTPTVHRHIP